MSRPKVVCLCGSTRFGAQFRRANFAFTMGGWIVLSVGCDTKSDDALRLTPGDKARLDELHLRKIDLADRVYVLNVGGYVGESTKREIAYTLTMGRVLEFLEPEKGEAFMEANARELGALAADFATKTTSLLCVHCSARPATCIGLFGDMQRPDYACDQCCHHDGQRAGHVGACDPLAPWVCRRVS